MASFIRCLYDGSHHIASKPCTIPWIIIWHCDAFRRTSDGLPRGITEETLDNLWGKYIAADAHVCGLDFIQ